MSTRMRIGGLLTAALLVGSTAVANPDDDDKKLLTLPAPAHQMTVEQWHSFGDNLERAIASGHDGLQNGAMRLAIQHSNFVDIDGATIDLMRIYRNHTNDNVRRLAVVTLASTGNRMALNYLRLHIPFEQSKVVKRTMAAAVSAHS